MEGYWLISEAAREVEVESHVLRYWEEELKLPIKRNEQGHRYYTREDVEFFKQIKGMKEKGLQLKAIKVILKNGELDVLADKTENMGGVVHMEDKTQRLQWLLQQLIREAVRENNRELCQEIKESVVKELDYQFRNLEEREELRDAAREQREEEHFRKLDDLLRKKARRGKGTKDLTAREAVQTEEKQGHRKVREELQSQMEDGQKNKRGGIFKTSKSR